MYTMVGYEGASIPSWVSLDSSSGLLRISTPNVSSDFVSSFNINSVVNGVSDPIQNLIKIAVLDCTVQNCLKCSITSGSSWSTWVSNYDVNSSGLCVQDPSDLAKNLRISLQILFGLSLFAMAVISFLNSSELITLWSILNQVKLFLKHIMIYK